MHLDCRCEYLFLSDMMSHTALECLVLLLRFRFRLSIAFWVRLFLKGELVLIVRIYD